MGIREVGYSLYERRLMATVRRGPLPAHVGLIMDGNRRWARQAGLTDVSEGHRRGAEHVSTVLGWCAGIGVREVSVYLASTDNMGKRGSAELDALMSAIERMTTDRFTRPDSPWRLHVAGRPELLPDTTAHALKQAVDATAGRDTGHHLTFAIGYGGREEVVDSLRCLLDEQARAGGTIAELAEHLTEADIARRLYTGGRPDPDLVIRTSGEQRLSNFLLWQTAYAQLHFCDVYWPGFRHVDFLRALRSYAARAAATDR
jgi:short-chain Z-isoprenyl diphosphate synthase